MNEEITEGVCPEVMFSVKDGFCTAITKLLSGFASSFLHGRPTPLTAVSCIHDRHFPTKPCTSCANLWYLCNAYRFDHYEER